MATLKELFCWEHPALCKGRHDWLVLFNIITINMLAIISSIGVVLADTSIEGSLVIDATKTVWISLIFLVVVAATVPVAAWAAEYYGYKRTLFVGISIFIVSSFLEGFATDYYTMILLRGISGIGGGVIFPLSLTIITRSFAKQHIAIAVSLYIALAFGVGIAIGFLIGGYFSEWLSWRMIFWINLVTGVMNLLLTWLLQVETKRDLTKKFNIPGYLSFILFVAALLTIVNSAKQPWNTEGWSSPFIIVCIAIGFLSAIFFLHCERRSFAPIFPPKLFKIRSFTVGCVAMFFVGAMLFGTGTTYGPLLEENFLYSKSKIGLLLAPFGLVFGMMGSCSSYLTRIVDMRIISLIGMSLITASCFLNHGITIQSDHAQLLTVLLIRAVGLGLSLGPLTALALSEVSAEDTPQASVAVTIFRQMGGAFGGSILALIQMTREVFHTQRFGEQIDIYSARFEQHLTEMTIHLQQTTGASLAEAKKQAILLLINNAERQSSILSLNDAYYIIGWVLCLVLALIIASMRFHHKIKI
jgi:MFS transporter, DHA2 family, multidrug resistance protein